MVQIGTKISFGGMAKASAWVLSEMPMIHRIGNRLRNPARIRMA
jgi:hypothetical protein